MAGSPGNGRPAGPAIPRLYNQYDSYLGRDRSPDRRSNVQGHERSSERRGSGRSYSPKRTRSPPRNPSSYDGGKYGPNDSFSSRGHGRRVSRDEFSRSMSPRKDKDPRSNSSKDSPVQLQAPPATTYINTRGPSSLDPETKTKSINLISKVSDKPAKLPNTEQKSVDILGASLADIFIQLVSESVDAAFLQSKQLIAGTLQASAKTEDQKFRKNGEQFPTSTESHSLKLETAARNYTSICEKVKKKEELVKALSASAAAKVIPMLLEATESSSIQIASDKLKVDVESLEKRCQGFQTQYEEQRKILDEMRFGSEQLDTIVKAQKNVIDKQTLSLESLKHRLSELEKKSDLSTQMQSLSSRYSGLESQSRETAASLHAIKQWQEKATADVSIALKSKADTEKCLKDIKQDITNIKNKPSTPPPAAALPPDVLEKLDMVQSLSTGISRHDKFHDNLQKRVIVLEGKSTAFSNNCRLLADDQIENRTRFPSINARLDAVEARADQLEQSSQALQKKNSAAMDKLESSHVDDRKFFQQKIDQKEAETSLGVSKFQQRLASVESNEKSFVKSSDVARLDQRVTAEMQQLSQQVVSEKQTSAETFQVVAALTKRLDKLEAGDAAANGPDVSDIRERLKKLETTSAPDASSLVQILTRLDKVEDVCEVAGEETDKYVGELINGLNDKLEKTTKALEDRIGSLENGVSQICENTLKNQASHTNISDAQERISALERASQFPQYDRPPMQEPTFPSTTGLQALESRITKIANHFGSTFARLDDPRFSSLTQKSEANAAAFDSLEARYCSISTGDIYQAMASQFSANELPQLSQLQHSVSTLLLRVNHIENNYNTQSTDEKIRGMEEQAGLLNGRIEMLEIQLPEMAKAESFSALKTQVDEMDKMLNEKATELQRRIQDGQAMATTTRTGLNELRTEVEVNKRSAANKLAEFILDVKDNIESIQENRPVRAPVPVPINGAKRKNMGSMNNGHSTHSPSPGLTNGYSSKSPEHSPGPLAPRKKTKISRRNYLNDDEPADFDEIPVRAPSDEDD